MHRFVLFVLVALYPGVALHAQDVRGLAATCSACHGPDGRAVAGQRSLAGMPKDDLARAMRAYRSGERTGTLMPQLAKGYSDAEIDAIAAWYAARNPSG